MNKIGFYGYVYDFGADYDTVAVNEILDFHKYLMKKHDIKWCLDFLKTVFYSNGIFSCNALNAIPLKCVSVNNQKCIIRTKIININDNEPFSIKVNKSSGSCNKTNDPNSKFCVPDVVKNINVKVFNLMSKTNETRYIEWHESCKCKCRLDGSV